MVYIDEISVIDYIRGYECKMKLFNWYIAEDFLYFSSIKCDKSYRSTNFISRNFDWEKHQKEVNVIVVWMFHIKETRVLFVPSEPISVLGLDNVLKQTRVKSWLL